MRETKLLKQIPDYLVDKEIYLRWFSHILSISLALSIVDNILREHYFLLGIDIFCILSANFGVFVLFRKYHYYIPSRLLMLGCGMLGASAASLITGAKFHNEHYLLVLIATSFLIFHQSERKWSFICASIAAGLYLVLIQFPEPSLPFDQGNWNPFSIIINQVSYISFFILSLLGLSKSYDKAIELFSNQKKKWQTLSEASPVGIFKVNLQNEIVYANSQFNSLIGTSGFDKLALNRVLPTKTTERFEIWKNQNRKDSFFEEIIVESSRDQKVSEHLYLKAEFDKKDKVVEYVGVMIDVSHQRELEAKLVEASKMASLGRMAGALAHEISNPITAIKLQMALLMRKASKNLLSQEELKKADKTINAILDRIVQITHGLRIVARDQRFSTRNHKSVESIFSETLFFCQERIKQVGIHFELSLDDKKEHLVNVNSVEISQVIINLLNNAIDAMETSTEKKITVQIESDGNSVITKVTDSGTIDPLIASKIMEPFFTTKAVGKGTGLGLSISQSIIENHGGQLYLNRESEKTQFIIQLPLAEPLNEATL